MAEAKTALVVSAHAADFVWRAAGAIALHAKAGWQVTIVCLSFGARGESANLWRKPGATLEGINASRRAEAETAAKILGAHELIAFDMQDYPLPIGPAEIDHLADVMRKVQPSFILSHSMNDPYNVDHPDTTAMVFKSRMIAQAWGYKPGEKILGAPQMYLFEPHQTEQCNWKPDTLLDISSVWEQKLAAIHAMQGQEHLWSYYTNVAEQRGNQARRNSGGQAGAKPVTHAEAYMSVFPRIVSTLD
jgi:4-oxalomesaconate hydratase